MYCCRDSINDGIMRATDVTIDGEYELVCGYGDEDNSCAVAFRDSGVRVFFANCDAIIFRSFQR